LALLVWMAQRQAFDRVLREERPEMTADRVSYRVGRREREAVRRKPRQQLTKRIWPEPVRGKNEATGACAFLEKSARKTLSRRGLERRFDKPSRKRRLERHAAMRGESAIVVFRGEPAIGNQDVMRLDAPSRGECGGTSERCLVGEPANKEVIFAPRLRARGCAQARKPRLDVARVC